MLQPSFWRFTKIIDDSYMSTIQIRNDLCCSHIATRSSYNGFGTQTYWLKNLLHASNYATWKNNNRGSNSQTLSERIGILQMNTTSHGTWSVNGA